MNTQLPGLNCGDCGCKSCAAFQEEIEENPDEIKRCIHLQNASRTTYEGGTWKDTLGREYDFILDVLKGDQGPRETILPHNPMLTRELEIEKDDILIGRPLGMSCGCPITHCGIVKDVDKKTGVIVWCVTGPLGPRSKGFKDLGYYMAEAYEGIVFDARTELKIGMRYWFLPHRCMLQWRHSGLINFINNTKDGKVVRIEGLFIG
ncbi:MAG: (Fe-S)-binding protein [Candidatus Freyarchaeum deiterrae]